MKRFLGRLLSGLQSFVADRSGNVLVITAITMPVALGAAGLGVDVANWYLTNRDMQHAADSAVQAAATNRGDNYDVEAKAVAALYGFVDGVDNVSVVASNKASCPSGGNNCYSVTITGAVVSFLAPIVGYAGTTTITTKNDGGETAVKATTISANSIAMANPPREYCVLALATSGAKTGIRSNGSPSVNLAGCNTMSNSGATCNGHDTNADFGDAAGTNNGCGKIARSDVKKLTDPYSGLAANIPADTTCAGVFPQAPTKNGDPSLPTSNKWTGTKSLTGNVTVCGDLQLTGDVTINASSGAVLIIRNGDLDTNGYTLKTSDGSGLTVVFTGSNTGGYTHIPKGGGMLDIAAPTTGVWKGIALYQDPNLTSGVDISEAGNSPAWSITGLVYLPRSSVTLSGIVNKASNGKSCFGLVVDNLTLNGTGSILAHGECSQAGLALPQGDGDGRSKLVG